MMWTARLLKAMFCIGAMLVLANGAKSAHAAEKATALPNDAELATWVDQRIAERQPSAEDKRFDEIGWVREIGEAMRLARESRRPVFLFTHDGRMNVGRC